MVSLHKNLKCVEPENNMVPEGMSIPDPYSIHCDHVTLIILQKAICGIFKGVFRLHGKVLVAAVL